MSNATVRVAAIYLAIIMLLSISFSAVFYHTSARQFARPIPPQGQRITEFNGAAANRFDSELRAAIDNRLAQTREALLVKLIWLNIYTLLLGAVISYLLARWSLRPIEEAMDSQTQFVSDASHELRTPLTVLQSTNEVALRKPKLTIKEARTLISHNIEEVKKLRDLSNALLDVLKKSNGPAVLTPVQLQDTVSEAMTPVVSIAQQKNITIEDTVPRITAQTNHALLARIISILLDNAVKYSHNDSKVTISATKSGKKALLHVTDTGRGIQESDLPHIFKRFYRADKSRSAAADTPGYGLGLSIASKIAHRIGANITVKSVVNEGSTFTIELPLAAPKK